MPDPMTAAEQLEIYQMVLWRPADLIELRLLPTERGGEPAPLQKWVVASKLVAWAGALQKANERGSNLYAGVLPRLKSGGALDVDCAPGWAVWADLDDTTPEVAVVTAQSMPPPTMVVNSGHGAHLFWGVEEATDPAELSKLVGDIAVLLGSDTTVRNPSRILRLPGFTNHKPPVAPASIFRYDLGARYRFAELRLHVPAAPAPTVPSAPTMATTPDRESILRRAKACLAAIPGEGQGARNAEGFRHAAKLLNDFALSEGEAWPIFCDWNARCTPPMDERELRDVFRSGGRHAKMPPGNKVADRQPAPTTPRHLATVTRAERSTPSAPHHGIPLPCACESTLAAEFQAEGRGERRTLALPWPGVSDAANALRPGKVCVLGGPPGFGKSILAMQLAIHAHHSGETWAFLPLEDCRSEWERRALAMLAGTWAPLNDSPGAAAEREALNTQYREELDALVAHVCENPTLPRDGTVPELPAEHVLDWTRRALVSSRLVFIDPFAKIDFPDFHPWAGETGFVRQLVGLAANSGGTVFLVCHTVKRSGKAQSVGMSGEDLQGAAALNRLCHTVLLLDAHPSKESEVSVGSMRSPVIHERTLIIGKARNGPGAGMKFAMAMDGPRFTELGVILREGKAGT